MRRIRREIIAAYRCLTTIDGANAYKLLLEGEGCRPPPDRTSLRKLYFHFARRNHPDVDSNNSNTRMGEGNNAYSLLRDGTDEERKVALDHLFTPSPTLATEATRPRSYPPPPWEVHYDTETPEEYQNFLKSLDGNEKLRFHKRWVDADGNRYAGIGEARVDKEKQRREASSTNQQSSAGTAIFIIYCIILYNIFQSWR